MPSPELGSRVPGVAPSRLSSREEALCHLSNMWVGEVGLRAGGHCA